MVKMTLEGNEQNIELNGEAVVALILNLEKIPEHEKKEDATAVASVLLGTGSVAEILLHVASGYGHMVTELIEDQATQIIMAGAIMKEFYKSILGENYESVYAEKEVKRVYKEDQDEVKEA